MNEFVQQHACKIIGMLSGFDRMLFRGTLRRLANAGGLFGWLWARRVLLKDFGVWSQELTARVREASEEVMRSAGRPMQYLNDSSLSKEQLARRIAERDGITSGLVCQFSAVEPCWSYDVYKNREQKKLQLVTRQRKCLHLYHYFVHEQVGFGHVRLQTWLAFNVKVCLNGREWLARQMDAAGMRYVKRDNCFAWVSDVERAQALLDEQLKTDWVQWMESIRELVFPSYRQVLGPETPDYYWSMDQSEWASDVMFKRSSDLSALYPRLISQGMQTMGSRQVMRFLGKRVAAEGRPITGNDEVVSDLNERAEGVRLKHRVNNNSVKMYDKQGSVLRVETTINDVRGFRVYRGTESDPDKKRWRHLRKGVADVHRRATVSRACNERYLSALATTECDQTVAQVLVPLSRALTGNGRRYRGLRLLDEQDGKLLEAVARGEWAINGFTNADVREALLGEDGNADVNERRRRSGRISRKLALLRAHGLIRRVNKTKRWMLTAAGRRTTTLLSVAKSKSAKHLLHKAA
jgi:hypothetical protein